MVEIHAADPLIQLADLVDQGMGEAAADPAARQRCAHLIDVHLRAEARLAVMRQLLPHPAVICGLGWGFLQRGDSRALFLGSVESERVLGLFGRARCLYNLIPGYYASSERVVEAAGNRIGKAS